MYSKDNKVVDRREMLKVKLKSLAAEAKIIRFEEKKTHGVLRDELHLHRVWQVRSEARHTHIAYGLIKGLKLEQIEPKSFVPFDWARVNAMIKKYGSLEQRREIEQQEKPKKAA